MYHDEVIDRRFRVLLFDCRPVRALPALLLLTLAGCPAGDSAGTRQPTAVTAGRPGSAADPVQSGLGLLRRGDLEGAEPHLLEGLRRSPHDPRLLEALGLVYARTDRWRKAEEMYRASLEAMPGRAGALLGLATVLIDTGRYPEALQVLEDVRRADPDNPAPQVKQALLLMRTARSVEAAAAARAVIGRRPREVEAHYVLGLALEDQGDLEGAAAAFGRAAELDPGHLGALSHLQTVAVRRRRPEAAERFRQAHRAALLRRRVEERVRGHRLKGVEAFNRADYATALVEFEAIARQDPDDFQVHLYLGSTLIALERRSEARAAIGRSLQLQPRNERALMELGRLEAMEEHLDAAVSALRQAIVINPEFAEPHYYLAGIHAARGEAAAADDERRRYQELRARSQGAAMEIVAPGMGVKAR